MISLIALIIAFLTLLVPSAEAAREAQTADQPAMWAESLDPFAPLLGAWEAVITLPEGETEVAELMISRPASAFDDELDGAEAPRALLSMGHGKERFTGPLAAHFDGDDIVFAAAASSPARALGTATITGRMNVAGLSGSAYLQSQERLITWTARPAAPMDEAPGA